MAEQNPNDGQAAGSKLTYDEIKAKNALLKKMEQNGDYDRIKGDLYAKLIQNDAWRETMFQATRDVVASEDGMLSEVTFGELSRALVQAGSTAQIIPESIKSETLDQIRKAYDA